MNEEEGNVLKRDDNVTGVVARLDQAQAELERGDADRAQSILSSLGRGDLPRYTQMRYRYLWGWTHLRGRHYRDADMDLTTALALAKQLDEREYVARINYRIGVNHYRQSEFADAERYFLRCWNAIYEGEVRDLLFRMYVDHSLGNCSLRLGRFVGAASHYRDALSYGADVDDRKWVSSVYWGLGLAYLQQGEVALAKLALEESLYLAEQAAADSFLVEVSAMYAVALIELNQARAAEQELRRTIYLSRQVGNSRILALAYGCLAEAQLIDERLSEARATATQALVEAECEGISSLDRAQVQLVHAKVLTVARERGAADNAYSAAELGMSTSGDDVKYADLLRDYARALISWREYERAAVKLGLACYLLRPYWRIWFD